MSAVRKQAMDGGVLLDSSLFLSDPQALGRCHPHSSCLPYSSDFSGTSSLTDTLLDRSVSLGMMAILGCHLDYILN